MGATSPSLTGLRFQGYDEVLKILKKESNSDIIRKLPQLAAQEVVEKSRLIYRLKNVFCQSGAFSEMEQKRMDYEEALLLRYKNKKVSEEELKKLAKSYRPKDGELQQAILNVLA